MNRLVNGLQPGLRANKGFQALAQQGSRYASTSAHGVESCGVIGAGQMGLGIAYVAARVSRVHIDAVCQMIDLPTAVRESGRASG